MALVLSKKHPYPVRSGWRRLHQLLNPVFFPTLHVNEFPKSGGTWLCRMLSECLGYRFDDNVYPWFGSTIIKHHRLVFSSRPTVTVVRDPRDVAVSYFHHCKAVFEDDGFNQGAVALMNAHVFVNTGSEYEALDAFVRMLTTSPISPAFRWDEFYSHPSRDGTLIIRYEDLRSDTFGQLLRIMEHFNVRVPDQKIQETVERHDINKILDQRSDKDGAFFIRSGLTGGWRSALSDEAVRLIDETTDDVRQKFGYD